MGKAIATASCILTTDNATAEAQIITPPSLKIKAQSPCYFGVLQIQVMGATQGSFTQTAPMVGAIQPTSTKVKSTEGFAVLEGDKTTEPVLCPATDPSTGATTTIPVTVTIQSAGQTKVSAS